MIKHKCKTCKGKGRWQVQDTTLQGETRYIWYECNTCHGTGDDPAFSGDGDFDIGGSDADD